MFQSLKVVAIAAIFSTSLGLSTAQAHEFWLMPEVFQMETGDQLRVNLHNGERMVGQILPYLPGQIKRFEMITGQNSARVLGRAGDLPALSGAVSRDGLTVIVHETADRTVTYDDFTVFERFVTHKAAPAIVAQHTARGLPAQGFTESYRRYAKSLVAVGSGAGADRATGLDIEIVALANPYTDDVSGGMPLQVLRNGAPAANAQIELFAQGAAGDVSVTTHQTDARGVAVVPAQSGVRYLADSVEISALPNNDAAAGPVWHSIWASLTYLVP